MEERKKLSFPIQGNDKCPICGCTERVGQELIRELKREGKLSSNSFPDESLVIQVPMFDPIYPPLATKFTIPVLQIHFDVCAREDCHHIYCTNISLVQQSARLDMPKPNPRRG